MCCCDIARALVCGWTIGSCLYLGVVNLTPFLIERTGSMYAYIMYGRCFLQCMIFASKMDLCEIDVFVLLAFCHQSLRRCPSKRGPSSQASHLCFGFSAHLLGRFYPQDRVANVSGWVGKGHEPAAAGSTSSGSGRVGWIWHRYWGEVFGACIYSWSPLFHQYAWSGLHGLVLWCSIDIHRFWLQETVAATVNSPHQLVISQDSTSRNPSVAAHWQLKRLGVLPRPHESRVPMKILIRPRHGGCRWGQHACQHLDGLHPAVLF